MAAEKEPRRPHTVNAKPSIFGRMRDDADSRDIKYGPWLEDAILQKLAALPKRKVAK